MFASGSWRRSDVAASDRSLSDEDVLHRATPPDDIPRVPPHTPSTTHAMPDPLRLLSTDFDGTIHEDFARPPIPTELQEWIAAFQARGGVWVINTGREMASLLESLGRAHVHVHPDHLILVEREIHRREHGRYVPFEPWNSQCSRDHAEVFSAFSRELADLFEHLTERYDATFYNDSFSPLCAIADSNAQMDSIQSELDEFCRSVPRLAPVRNDVYVRLSHVAYSKGTALAELARTLGIRPEETAAAGDHLNDLPMLRRQFAHRLVAPTNALSVVKAQVTAEGGYLAAGTAGHGVLEALQRWENETR
jgi:hydroxymethylpyrimidine pyrophosphatase-like HAD family hydrolase